jgi:integrase
VEAEDRRGRRHETCSPLGSRGRMIPPSRSRHRLRAEAAMNRRWHDLRHAAATKMAEAGVPESTVPALMGHLSRAVLERFSQVRLTAKRKAVGSPSLAKKPAAGAENAVGVPQEIPTMANKPTVQ